MRNTKASSVTILDSQSCMYLEKLLLDFENSFVSAFRMLHDFVDLKEGDYVSLLTILLIDFLF